MAKTWPDPPRKKKALVRIEYGDEIVRAPLDGGILAWCKTHRAHECDDLRRRGPLAHDERLRNADAGSRIVRRDAGHGGVVFEEIIVQRETLEVFQRFCCSHRDVVRLRARLAAVEAGDGDFEDAQRSAAWSKVTSCSTPGVRLEHESRAPPSSRVCPHTARAANWRRMSQGGGPLAARIALRSAAAGHNGLFRSERAGGRGCG